MTSTLAAALVEAQKDVRSVSKDARFGGAPGDRGPKYAYASSEAVYGEARRALAGAGLAASLSSSSVFILSYVDCYTTEQGEVRTDQVHQVMLRCQFELVHDESSEKRETTCELPVIAGKGRPLDKAIMGVRTTALAYYLRDLLLMQRGDYEEIDSRDEPPARGNAQPKRDAPREEAPQDDRPAHEIASAEIAACKTVAQLIEVAGKLEKTPDDVIGGAYRDALKSEWAARREALRAAAPKGGTQ